MTHPPPTPLYDRSESLEALGRIVARLSGGGSGSLVIRGEGGMGKTTLLGEARRMAEPVVRVATGRGNGMEVELPYGLAGQLFESLSRGDVTRPRPAGADPSELRGVVLARARSWMEELTTRSPVLLLVDDLHWCDSDSLVLLSFLLRRVEGPLGLVAAARPWPRKADAFVQALVEDGAEVVELAPLGRSGTEQLLRRILGREPTEEESDGAWRLAGGNPFLITQLAAMLDSEGRLPDPEHAQLGRFREELLLSAFVGLPPAAIACAQAAAVLGVEFRLALVAVVAGCPSGEAAAGLDVLFRAGLLRETEPGRAEFRHPMLQLALYGDLSPAQRGLLHTRAFDQLARLGELSLAARHAIAGDLVGDVRAIEAVRAAAEGSVAAGAVLEGVELMQAAAVLTGGVVPPSLQISLGDAFLAAGRPEEAAASYQKALDQHITGEARIRALHLESRALAYSGDIDASNRTSIDALTHAQREAPHLVGTVLVDRLHVVWQLGGPAKALDLISDVRCPPSEVVDDPTFQSARCFVRFCGEADEEAFGTLASLVADLESGPQAADTQASPFDPMLVYMAVARALERFDEDDRVYEVACRRARSRGVLHALVPLDVSRADSLIRRGRPSAALAVLDEAARNAQVEPIMEEAVALTQALALAELGRLDDAASRLPARGGGSFMWMVRLSSLALDSRLRFDRGQPDEACDGYSRLLALVEELGVNVPSAGCQWVGHAMETFQARRLDAAARLCEWLGPRNARMPSTWPVMVELSGRAELAAAEGDQETAGELYARAVALPVPLQLERARVLLRYGAWLRRTNQLARSRAPVAEALAIAEAAGAERLAARARAELRVAGGRRRSRRAPRDELTAQERRVAQLASDGLTTREMAERLYVSSKTVESHLTRVYQKLGVRSKRAVRGLSFDEPDGNS